MSLFDHRLKHDLMRKMLLHNSLTRRQIAEAFGVSLPAVTRHVRWLEDNELVSSRQVRMADIKRPVEMLHLRAARAMGLTVLLRRDGLRCEVIGADGQPLHALDPVATAPTQLAVTDALRQVVDHARQYSKQHGQALETVAVGIHGYMEPSSGMIFGVRGIPDWEPCLLDQVIESMRGLAVVPATSVACKLYGLSARQREDHRIGYIERMGGALAIATLMAGSLHWGRFGTANGAVHVRVSDSDRRCFCGRTGCLDDHLRLGDATDRMFHLALPDILDAMSVRTLGLEVDGDGRQTQAICQAHGVQNVHICTTEDDLVRHGLRVACARVMLERLVERARPVVRRAIVNPAAFTDRSAPAAGINKDDSNGGKTKALLP